MTSLDEVIETARRVGGQLPRELRVYGAWRAFHCPNVEGG